MLFKFHKIYMSQKLHILDFSPAKHSKEKHVDEYSYSISLIVII